MKKRLLITSIVMMLVVAVALSTATYAWFTSNNAVTASSLTMTAATNEASALGIDWIGGSGAGSEIVFNGTAESILPMIPNAITVGTTTAPGGTANEMTFATSTVKSVGGHLVFNENGDSASPFTFSNGSATEFYVSNLSTANAVPNVRVTATIGTAGGSDFALTNDETVTENKEYFTRTGTAPNYIYSKVASPAANPKTAGYYEKSAKTITKDGSALIRIGIFTRATAGTGNYILRGILASAADDDSVTYGTIVAGANAEKNPSGASASLSYGEAVTSIDLGGLTINDNTANGTDQIDVVAVVWMDGYELDDNHQGYSAVISLTFSKTAAV